MSGSFFGLSIARSGLFASQRSLNVVGHNISNVNTPGYSRQRVDVKEGIPLPLPGGQGMIGSGVQTTSIRQMRDEFLDFKIRKEFTTSGEWEERYKGLEQIQAIFGEPSDNSIRKAMDEFYESLHELEKNPDNLTARTAVREKGIAFTKTINHMYEQLKDLQRDLDFSVGTTVSQINGYAKEIASLNTQISSAELGGSHANDLRDQRNLLIDELSALANIEVNEAPIYGGTSTYMNISIDGNLLVSHDDYNLLKTVPRDVGEENNYVDNYNLLDVKWENGNQFQCTSGKLKGLLDLRDEMDGNSKGIPYYLDKINEFSTTFAAEFNFVHGQGYGLAGAGNGISFFNHSFITKVPQGNVPTGYDTLKNGPNDVTDGNGFVYITQSGINHGGVEWVDHTTLTGKSDAEKIQNFEKDNRGYTLFKVEDKVWVKVKMITGDQLGISKEIEKNVNNIAASKNNNGNNGLAGDNSNVLDLIKLREDKNMFAWGSPDGFFKSMISNLGVNGQEAHRMVVGQGQILQQLGNQRASVSGVSLDEEMTNMIKYQQAYNASARMITTVDEMLDKIINGMGVVGR